MDAIYGLVAGFGLTFISNFLMRQQVWIRLFGGLLLLGIGMKIFWAGSVKEVVSLKVSGPLRAYVSTFFVTLTNPVTFLSIAAVFAGLGNMRIDGSLIPIIALVLGLFLGSMLWWFLVSNSIHFFRWKKTDLELKWVNRISGVLITGFALAILLSLTIY